MATPKAKTKPKEVAPTIEVHPLFVSSRDVTPLGEEIATIDVRRCKRGAASRFLEWVQADELPDEGALLDRYGPGDYELVGRNANRSRILRRAYVAVGDEPEEEAAPAPATPASSPANEAMSLFGLLLGEMREARKSQSEMMLAFSTAQSENARALVSGMSGLMEARVKDAAHAKGSGSGIDPTKLLEIHSKAMEEGMALGAAMADKDDSDVELAKTFVQGMQAANGATKDAS